MFIFFVEITYWRYNKAATVAITKQSKLKRIVGYMLPGKVIWAAYRWDDVRGAKLGNWRYLFDDVVAEQDIGGRHERTRVTAVDGDRFRRVDEHSRHVVFLDELAPSRAVVPVRRVR